MDLSEKLSKKIPSRRLISLLALVVLLAVLVVVVAAQLTSFSSFVDCVRGGDTVPRKAVAEETRSSQDPLSVPFIKLDRHRDFTVDFYGMTYKGNTGNLIDRRVLYLGAFEKDVLYFLRDALLSTRPKRGVFLDIGANVGQHSLFMSRYASRVIAIEPYPPVLDRFAEMIEMNQIDNIEIHPIGYGKEPGTMPFYAPPNWNQGTGSFVQHFKDYNQKVAEKDELSIVVGDDDLKEVERIDLVKIDIEGFEKPALQGLEKTLERSRPVVVMEYTPSSELAFNGKDDMMAVFPSSYEVWKMVSEPGDSSGRYRLAPYDFDPRPGLQYMLVAFGEERREQIPKQGPVGHH